MTTSELERELHDFWCAFEATIGFRSTFSAMLAAHAGVTMGSGPPSGWDPYAEVMDQIGAGSRTYRALRRLGTDDLVVLYRLFGPRNPRSEHDALGELSPLAVLTDAAEDARDEIVLRESTRRSDAVGARVAVDVVRRRRELEQLFWSEVGALAKAKDERRVEAGWTFLGQLLDAFACDGAIRAQIGAIEATDREVTVEAAVRARIKQADFIAAVIREATAMRAAALASYRAARAEERLSAKAERKARQERTQVQETAIPSWVA